MAARVGEARRRRPRAAPDELARELGLEARSVLEALSGEARPVGRPDLPGLVAELQGWGRLRLVVRNRNAVAELAVDLVGARAERGGLTVAGPDFEAHLALLEAVRAYFVERPGHGPGRSRSVAFVDETGAIFCQLYLWRTRQESDADPASIARFEGARERFGEKAGS